MSCAKDKDFKRLLQRYENTVKQLNKAMDGLDANLNRRFATLEKQVAKLEKEAFGRLSASSVKAEQKRSERDLMAYVDAALAKYDRKKGR